MAEQGLSSGMRWSSISVVGREVARTVFTILLARIVGPDDFGIVAQAMVFVGIVSILLDQGFSSALVQREKLEPGMPGVVVTVNLGVGAALSVATIAIAPLWADWMNTPQLALVLVMLAPDLLLRAATVTPRVLLARDLQFRLIGIADVVSALAGGILGLAVAFAGGSYWALVVQVVSTDAVLLVVLLIMGAGYRPNMQFRLLREIAGFSWRAFAAGLLINSFSRNIDNLLVGRFQGPQALAFYGLAYRLLLLPVQLACTTVGGVLFPAFARISFDIDRMRSEMVRATRTLAILALPVMALVAAGAPQLVLVLFGPDWAPAIPIIQVLALAGAAQAIYRPSTTPMVLGLGDAGLNLRYAWLTAIFTTIGIVGGLPFGPFGVAAGYTVATAAIVPVEWLMRRRLLGMSLGSQAAAWLPGIHVAAWVSAAYLLVSVSIPGRELLVLVVGGLTGAAVGIGVLWLVHRRQFEELIFMVRRMIGGRRNEPSLRPSPADQGRHRSGRGRHRTSI
ncbi:lipopolysaccharide biosynthesis protein [Aldersonia sp. NBC_00410]|uniref:lipopolysaccharide biosynthesis protein n=1 Tax=Aldersonia sp. NBC_00410 TaxID=2975954 RepID=UPI00224ED874|nr:lipopolysaccharide biosynthesis protein [Aldersonia sp. NBC_00410]MCX5041709.1 lipopolysaccharide biosynthesis protein [Aldersonia sp. NBC_00410]